MSYIPSSTSVHVTLDDTVYARRSGSMFTGNLVLDNADIVLTGLSLIDGRQIASDGLILDAINSGVGLITRTGSSTFRASTLLGTVGDIQVTNGDGVLGNPTFSLVDVGAAGTFTKIVVDSKGRVVSGSTPTTLAGYNITDAVNTSQLSVANSPNTVAVRDAAGNIAASSVTATTLTGTLVGNAASATRLVTPRTINGVAFDGTQNINFGTDSVAEGTSNLYFTTARAAAAAPVQSVAGKTGAVLLSATDVTGLANSATISASSTNTPSQIVLRDASGNFTAGTITAALTGNASTATRWATARTITMTGDATGTSTLFDGSANASLPITLGTVNGGVGTFGSATTVPVMTATAKGLVTNLTSVAIAFPVTSVQGRTGAVSVTASDLGLGNVENKTSANIRSELTLANVTTALGYTPENTANRNQPNGYVTLGVDGKIAMQHIPAIALSDTFVVGTQAAMLSLLAETGDIAIRSDLSKTFILKGNNPTLLGDWQELLSPASNGVTSVAGRTGAVTLTSSDVGLSNVTNSLQVVNAGGTPSIQVGLSSARPAAGVPGRLFISTDLLRFTRDNGTSWDLVQTAFTGDVTSSSGSTVLALVPTGFPAGTYTNIVLDTKGRVTAAAQFYSGSFPAVSGTTVISATTTPSITEGSQLFSVTVTPGMTSAKFVLELQTVLANSNNDRMGVIAVYRDSVCINAYTHNMFDRSSLASFKLVDSPNRTTPVTYSVRVGVAVSGSTWYVGTDKAGPYFNGLHRSHWTLTEVFQ
jgi:hypothetical protein